MQIETSYLVARHWPVTVASARPEASAVRCDDTRLEAEDGNGHCAI